MLGMGYWDIGIGAAFLNYNLVKTNIVGMLIDLLLIGMGAYFIATND
jgi:hypothetical protein